jgi:adenylosuccinate lyase
VIERYALPEIKACFSDEARLALWLEVELLALEGWAEVGRIPPEVPAVARARAPQVDHAFVQAVAERERVTNHDLAAFVDVVQEAIGMPEGRFVHFGLTSSDVVDTALGATLSRAGARITEAARDLVRALVARARKHASTPMAGRTHGMHAEPTTFGAKLALFALQAGRDLERIEAAVRRVAVGKVSGAVGTYSTVDPRVEAYVLGRLGLAAVPASQVVARDRHAEVLFALASAATTVEALATEVRHLARSEIAEVEEPFGAGQKGSSAMPHKRNPVLAERLCGLARLLRGYVVPGLEDVVLWHERDISHSSVERIVLPDACMLAYYALRKAAWLVDGLVVDEERMRRNLDSSQGAVFSQHVLLALVERGMERDRAYRIVQRAARLAGDEGRTLLEVLSDDPEVAMTRDELEACCSLERALAHTSKHIDALDELEARLLVRAAPDMHSQSMLEPKKGA